MMSISLTLYANLEDGNISHATIREISQTSVVDLMLIMLSFAVTSSLSNIQAFTGRVTANNKVLQRIYGVCFPTAEELEAHLTAS